MESWGNFYLTAGGGAATLTGLLFVALSINKDRIGEELLYRSMARQTVSALMAILVIALLALIPGQSHSLFGSELIGGGLIGLVVSLFLQWRVLKTLTRSVTRFVIGSLVYNAGMVLLITAAWGLLRGWQISTALLVLFVLTFGGLAVVTCWELLMRVDTPAPSGLKP